MEYFMIGLLAGTNIGFILYGLCIASTMRDISESLLKKSIGGEDN